MTENLFEVSGITVRPVPHAECDRHRFERSEGEHSA